MRSFPDTLTQIIKKSDLNVNQISKCSGISNTYLTKIVNKKINHPGKDKIASVLLALNFNIFDINQVLADYDYLPLNPHDIPQILENNKKRRFEGRIIPHYEYIYFELAMAALAQIGGTTIIIKDRPSGIFIPMDLYMMKEFPIEEDNEAAKFFMTFTHDVVAERKRLFLKNCKKGFKFEAYMCRECLVECLKKNVGHSAQKASMARVELFAKYFANAVSAGLKFPDQHLHNVIDRCTYFQFMVQDAEGEHPKVSYTSEKKHYYKREWDQLNIEGFISNGREITDLFFNEVENCRQASKMNSGINTPEGFWRYIQDLFNRHGVGGLFEKALSDLMAFQGLKLY
ncbi:MAG: hypothetical protein MI862_09665 [Desulfobacterales bacterium]|nr:hypothetical protein [Desulfobacterales bacterium]